MSESDMSSSDDASARMRSSPMRIAQVVSKFGAEKRAIVSDIGFGGMLKVPAVGNLDTKFTLSLLDKIDIKRRSIKLNETTFIQLCATDVHKFLAIPNGPNKLIGLEDRSPDEKMDFIRLGIGSLSHAIDEKNSLKAAEEIVTADYPNGMSGTQADQFKVSFVCFCMGNFLVAKYGSNHGIKAYWGSLLDPSAIVSYDFCQAVVDEIIEAARHVQKENKANRVVKNVSGCHLFLQAKFLDSLNLGILNIELGAEPRIQVFTHRVLVEMKIYLRQNAQTLKLKEITAQVQASTVVPVTSSFQSSTIPAPVQKSFAVPGGKNIYQPYNKFNKSPSTPVNLPYSTKANYAHKFFSFVDTIKKPRSTEFLTAYSNKGVKKKLNDDQLNDLRVHNCRMRLFVNSFKASTLEAMDCPGTSLVSCKEVFSSNANKLLEDILNQVFVLSTSLHDHCAHSSSHSISTPKSPAGGKRSYEDLTFDGHVVTQGAKQRRDKAKKFPIVVNDLTGKNLIHDLTAADDLPDETELVKPLSSLGFLTPDKTTQNHFLFSEMMIDRSPYHPSSSSIVQDSYNTPSHLMKLTVQSPPTTAYTSDYDPFEELLSDTQITLYQPPPGIDVTYTPIEKVTLFPTEMAKNPWFYRVQSASVDGEGAQTLFHWLSSTTVSLDSWWIVHATPTKKMIAGNDFKSVFTRGYNCTSDIMDLGIRRFGQTDKDMYGVGKFKRWMHPFETDFARMVLQGEDYLNSRSIRQQISGKSNEYDISNCRMIVVPHIPNESWTAYFWDMKEHLVHIVDPTFHISRACELHELHSPIVDKLQDALKDCLCSSFVGWEINWKDWKRNYVQPFLNEQPSNASGLLTLLAMRNFNGTRFELPSSEVSLERFAVEQLYDMLSVQGNTGKLPYVYIQSID